MRADRVVDGFAFGSCTVGGTDATDAVVALWDRLDREDVRDKLTELGVAPSEVKQRVANLSDAEVQQLAAQSLAAARHRPQVQVRVEGQ